MPWKRPPDELINVDPDIQHVGSTAVPGCEAKPIIDIAVSISDEGKVAECVPLLAGLGYTYKGENGIPGRHYFQRGEPACLFHLHMSTPEHPNWVNMLRFREHLRHPEPCRLTASKVGDWPPVTQTTAAHGR